MPSLGGLQAWCQKPIFTISECYLSTGTEHVMSGFRQVLLLGIWIRHDAETTAAAVINYSIRVIINTHVEVCIIK